jgi:integrase/recombinase XerD
MAKWKRGKARTVVIGDRTTRALLAHRRSLARIPASDDTLWQSRYGRRLALAGFRAVMARLSHRVGVRITPHMLRRTFALMALRQGMDLISLQRLMAHADLSVTSHYIAIP